MVQTNTILKSLPNVLTSVSLEGFGKKYSGKVRDFYKIDSTRILVTTDRQSAFDVILGNIPFKGAVLNLLAAYWFQKTKHIVPNHLIAVPHPNVLIAKDCQPIPVEMIVRGYISGVTKTSIWYSYQQGERLIYGLKFPEGLRKNEKLPKPTITPTTHPEAGSSVHDERLTREEIINRKIVPEKLYKQMENASLALFEFGSKLCTKRGLILVDTKYEFGLYKGKLMLIDEIHTPDSSRFWIKKTYKERFGKGLEPENFDKEFLRLWYANRGYRGDGEPPKMPQELIVALAKRYIGVYEMITGTSFHTFSYPIEKDITRAISQAVSPAPKRRSSAITYTSTGVNYATMDPLKRLAQLKGKETAKNLKGFGMKEVEASRGESAYVWEEKDGYRAMVVEGLGTKNRVADAMRKITGKTYYDAIAQDTVAMMVNDLIVVGAAPQVVNAYFAVGSSDWFSDEKRTKDLVTGWAHACMLSGASWGGGETPTLKSIIEPDTIDLAGSAVGMIRPKKRLTLGDRMRAGDAIVLIESSGIHANGLTLARTIASKLPEGYATKLTGGAMFGEALLTPTHIYSQLVDRLFDAEVDIHYMIHITGHGWRKLMRASSEFTYRLHTLPPSPAEFLLMQEAGSIPDEEMYATFNMGAGFALVVPKHDVGMVQKCATVAGFKSWNAGVVENGSKQVIIAPKHIIFSSETLNIR